MPLFTPTCIRSHGRCMHPMRWIAIASEAGDGKVQRKDAINSGNLTRWDRHGRVQRHSLSIPRLRQGRPLAWCPHAFPRRAAGGTDLGGIDGTQLELCLFGRYTLRCANAWRVTWLVLWDAAPRRPSCSLSPATRASNAQKCCCFDAFG